MKILYKISAGIAALATAFSLVACSGDRGDVIKIGTTDQGQQQWQVFEQKATEAGLKIQIVPFGDYSIPNRALSSGEIDVNNFQHLMFLADYNVKTDSSLTPIGATEVIPMGLYYQDHNTLEAVKEAGTVAIPNDPTNQGRALHVLSQAKLISLKDPTILSPTPADVDESQSKVKVTAVDAAQTVTSYKSGTPSIINNSFLSRGEIDPLTAIFKDDPSSPEAQPFINAFVTTKDKAQDPSLLKLVEIWHSPEVQKALKDESHGTSVPVTMDEAALAPILSSIEDKIRAQN